MNISIARGLYSHSKILVLIIFINILLTPILKLARDGSQILALQKGALILNVFAVTSLNIDQAHLLEEKLSSLEGVREVISLSPEELIKKTLSDSNLAVDQEWLLRKMAELKGKDNILPWSYRLYLKKWNEQFLENVVKTIHEITVGEPKVKVVSEVNYDRERWSLLFSLYNYERWLNMVLGVSFLAVILILIILFFKILRNPAFPLKEWFLFSFAGGLGTGLAANFIYILTIKLSFIYNFFSIKEQIVQTLLPQILISLLLSLIGFGYSGGWEHNHNSR